MAVQRSIPTTLRRYVSSGQGCRPVAQEQLYTPNGVCSVTSNEYYCIDGNYDIYKRRRRTLFLAQMVCFQAQHPNYHLALLRLSRFALRPYFAALALFRTAFSSASVTGLSAQEGRASSLATCQTSLGHLHPPPSNQIKSVFDVSCNEGVRDTQARDADRISA